MTSFEELPDLAQDRLGGAAIACSDDFFAPKENLVLARSPVFLEHEYTERGKWMDGWESRRKREPADESERSDWCVVRLGAPTIVHGFVIDTSFFRGNFPARASIEGCYARLDARALDGWTELLPRSELRGDAKNAFPIAPRLVTHVRLNIFPDGGVARLRAHGLAVPDLRRTGLELDLAAIENGGRSLACSDMFFGNRHNLLMPGRAANMSDGWETRRRRGPGHDWNLVALAGRAIVRAIEIDTGHFKGNFPDACTIDARDGEDGAWRELLPRAKLQAHTRHLFVEELAELGPITHVRLNVFPDGGVSRMRVLGSLTEDARVAVGLMKLASMPNPERELLRCCASTRWAREVARARPWGSEAALVQEAERAWRALGASDWLEAFAAHPAIGQSAVGQSADGERGRGWSSEEQRGASGAKSETLRDLAEENARYREKFGFVFLVCATGKSAEEMLSLLRARMPNDLGTELRVAAEEQRKITELRLRKLLLG